LSVKSAADKCAPTKSASIQTAVENPILITRFETRGA
jgi:hypothetical protein